MVRAPVIISYANKEERAQIAAWLQSPEYYEDAFLLPIRPDPAWVNAGFLLIKNPNGQELVSVNFWTIKDSSGKILGFSIDYPFDVHQHDIREIDLALPNIPKHSGRLPFEAMAWTAHAVFQKEEPKQVRARIRSTQGRQFSRIFARIGAVQTSASRLSLQDERYRDRTEYHVTPEMFYNSYWAKRYGLEQNNQ